MKEQGGLAECFTERFPLISDLSKAKKTIVVIVRRRCKEYLTIAETIRPGGFGRKIESRLNSMQKSGLAMRQSAAAESFRWQSF